MNSSYLDQWLVRKRERPVVSIRKKRVSRFKHYRLVGPRGQYGVVALRGEPAPEFAFESLAKWPEPASDYSLAVLDGILDELFATELGHVVANVRFTLESIQWHDVDSSAVAFYFAARGAVREILGRDQVPSNVAWPGPKA